MQIRREKLPELKEKRKQDYIAYFSVTNILTKRRIIQESELNSESSGGIDDGIGSTMEHRIPKQAKNSGNGKIQIHLPQSK